MPAGDDDEIGGGVRADFLEGVLVRGNNFRRRREALGVCKGGAVVNDSDGEPSLVRDAGQGYGDMSGAENIKHWLRQNRFHKNFQGAAADEAGIETGLVVQVEGHLTR